jgi:hypothetical protein
MHTIGIDAAPQNWSNGKLSHHINYHSSIHIQVKRYIQAFIFFSILENCPKPPCSVTNLRLELTSRVPYKGMARLKSVFYWEPATGTYIKPFGWLLHDMVNIQYIIHIYVVGGGGGGGGGRGLRNIDSSIRCTIHDVRFIFLVSSTYKKYSSHYELQRISHTQSMCESQFGNDQAIRSGNKKVHMRNGRFRKRMVYYIFQF